MSDIFLLNDSRYLSYFMTTLGAIYVIVILCWYWLRFGLDVHKKYVMVVAFALGMKSITQAWIRLHTIQNLDSENVEYITKQLAGPIWMIVQWFAAILIMAVGIHLTIGILKERYHRKNGDRRCGERRRIIANHS